MIVPARVAPPIALLVALITLTVVYNLGIVSAPREFFGDTEDIVLLLPGTGTVTSTGYVPGSLARVLATREDVIVASPEIVVMTSLADTSLFVRGVDTPAFLDLEEGRVVEGRSPAALDEAVAGADLARRLDLRLGGSVVLAGSIGEKGVIVRIVGVVEAPGLARDELLVSLPYARTLAALPSDGVHFIRVRASDPTNVSRLASSIQPTFTYSDVRLSSADVVAGEPITVVGDLTNWGIVAGSKEVNATVGTVVVGHTFVHVPARSTVSFTLPLEIESLGDLVVEVNPSLPLVVRPAPGRFESLPRSFVLGEETELRVVDERGAPLAGANVRLGDARNVTDLDGRARLIPSRLGAAPLVASTSEAIITTHEAFVVRPEEAGLAIARPLRLDLGSALVSANGSARLNVTLSNVGGAEGAVRASVTVDGVPRAEAAAVLAPGHKARVEVAIGGLSPGLHTIDVAGLRASQIIEVFGGDARVEAALRAREAAREDPGLTPRVGVSAAEYVDRIVRNVAIAAAAITIAAAALAALALATVWSRHLAERASEIGVLKALGADRETLLGIVSRRASLWSAAAALVGIAVGLALAWAVDASGAVRAFGHRVAPTWSAWGLLVLFVACVLANVVLARQIAGRLYDSSADALLGSHVFVPPPREAPTLREVVEADDA